MSDGSTYDDLDGLISEVVGRACLAQLEERSWQGRMRVDEWSGRVVRRPDRMPG